MNPPKKPLDTAEKVSLGFFGLCLSGFFTLTLANSQNWISEEFVTPAFQFLMATGGYAVFGKSANVFAKSHRDRYRSYEEREGKENERNTQEGFRGLSFLFLVFS